MYFGGVLKIAPDPTPTPARPPDLTLPRSTASASPASTPIPTLRSISRQVIGVGQLPFGARSVHFVSTLGEFEIELPAVQSIHEDVLAKTLLGEPAGCTLVWAPDNGALWIVEYCDLFQNALAEFTTGKILDQARDEALKDPFGVLIEETDLVLDSYPGRSLVARGVVNGFEATYKTRLYLAGARLYRVAASVIDENWCGCIDRIDEFLDSFFINET